MKIDINNLSGTEIDAVFFRKIIEKILRKEKKDGFSVSVAFVDGETIRQLNNKYRNKDKETDVLSFADSEVKDFLKENSLGEVIVCPSQVEKGEMVKVLIHGILHLLGYDHEKNEADAEKMKTKERYFLTDIGV